MISEAQKSQYIQNHNLQLEEFNHSLRSGQIRAQQAGGSASDAPTLSPDELEEIAAKRIRQQMLARGIEEDAKRAPIPQEHGILLHKPKGYAPQPNAGGVLNGEGQVPVPSEQEKRRQQESFRQQVQLAQSMQMPQSDRRAPRQRPASPPVPIPGQNGLQALGVRDSAQYKQQKMQESKQMLQQQELEQQAYQATLHMAPVLRSSDEYGLMSGRTSLNSGKMGANGHLQHQAPDASSMYVPLSAKKNVVPDRDPNSYFPSASVRDAHARQLAAIQESQQMNYAFTPQQSSQLQSQMGGFAEGGAGMISRGNGSGAIMSRNGDSGSGVGVGVGGIGGIGGGGGVGGMTIGQHNNLVKKESQRQYQQALDSDRQAKSAAGSSQGQGQGQGQPLSRISLSQIPQKGANSRHEQNSLFSPVKSGTNIIDTVGQYELDQQDVHKRRVVQSTYQAQLRAAQESKPIGADQPRVALFSQKDQRQHEQSGAAAFSNAVDYQRHLEAASRGNVSLPIDGNSAYTGYSHGGFNATDPTYVQLRAEEREKQQDFIEKVKQSSGQEPLVSPRTLMYRRKYPDAARDYDTSTPYGILANSLSKNEDVYAEKALQEGMKKMSQQLRVEQLEADRRMHEAARNSPRERVSLVKPKTRAQIDAEKAENYIPSGLPMFNPYDWNENALDYTWNVNQKPDGVGSLSGRQQQHPVHALPHATQQMYFGHTGQADPQAAAQASLTQQSQRMPGNGQGQQPSERMALYEENRPLRTSLELYPLDVEKVHRMQMQADYREGIKSDRTDREQQQRQEQQQAEEYMAQQQALVHGHGHNLPQLQYMQPVPSANPNLHNRAFIKSGLGQPSGISELASGRQPHVPPQAKLQSSYPQPRRVGGQMASTHAQGGGGGGQAGGQAAPFAQAPQQAGFRMSARAA
jgi:hypothetical protein